MKFSTILLLLVAIFGAISSAKLSKEEKEEGTVCCISAIKILDKGKDTGKKEYKAQTLDKPLCNGVGFLLASQLSHGCSLSSFGVTDKIQSADWDQKIKDLIKSKSG